jgi:NAD+ synthase (glutamine-hydrolysing)
MHLFVAQLNPIVGDIRGNADKILFAIAEAQRQYADCILFSELVLSGYPPEDFLLLPSLINEVERQLKRIINSTAGITAIVGLPWKTERSPEKRLYNSAAIISDRSLVGFHHKCLLPTYDVFDEARYFESGKEFQLWSIAGKKVAVTICEDIWEHSGQVIPTTYHRDPIVELRPLGPDLLLNLSASPFSVNKPLRRVDVCAAAAVTLQCPVVLCNQVGANDSLIFDGNSCYIDAKGALVQMAKGFETDMLEIDLYATPAKPQSIPVQDATADLYHALVLGVRDYFHKSGFRKACLGLSGGVDSAVVACIAVEALGNNQMIGLSMPSRYTSQASKNDAVQLAEALDFDLHEISIEQPFTTYLNVLGPYFQNRGTDTTEENLQARIRGMYLMAISNKLGFIVLNTANKSEIAMGYATLYGDMCGGLSVLADVTKGQVYALANWINREREIIPAHTLQRAPTAELRPNQKDSDSLPDYDIIDNVVQEYLEYHLSPEAISTKHHYDLELVQSLIKKIHQNEYKRRQSPPGLRISEKSFLIGRRFPIVQGWV